MKRLFKRGLRTLGYVVVRKPSSASPDSRAVLNQLLRHKKSEPLTIFDVGAYNGESAEVFRRDFPRSNIYCFEPAPETFQHLTQYLPDNAFAYNVGLSDITETLSLNVNAATATNSVLEFTEDAISTWNLGGLTTETTVPCQFQTLDEFCSEHGIEHIDILKIDVQGAEFKVLRGAERTFCRRAVDIVKTEVIVASTYHGQKNLGYYLEFFERAGYRLINLCDFSFDRTGKINQMDLIFERVDRGPPENAA